MSGLSASAVQKSLKKYADAKRAQFSTTFFKTEKGQYAEGDQFIGVRVPDQRRIAQQFAALPLPKIQTLLDSSVHEHRLTGLFILTKQFEKAKTEQERKKLYNFYVKNIEAVNNWDLVDATAHKIVGRYLLDKDRKILYTWARANHLWKNRISIITTWWFIREEQLDDTYALSDILLSHPHDLMHKAVGWMLREAGKKDVQRLEKYIRTNAKHMPRTCLRYAIEKFPEKKRKELLNL